MVFGSIPELGWLGGTSSASLFHGVRKLVCRQPKGVRHHSDIVKPRPATSMHTSHHAAMEQARTNFLSHTAPALGSSAPALTRRSRKLFDLNEFECAIELAEPARGSGSGSLRCWRAGSSTGEGGCRALRRCSISTRSAE
eukprot:3096194-Rhodomonas_salina.1